VKVDKGIVIEIVLFKSTRVYDFQTVNGIDTQFLWAEPDDGAVLLMQSINGEDFFACSALMVNPATG
jgi:hypothetical protein